MTVFCLPGLSGSCLSLGLISLKLALDPAEILSGGIVSHIILACSDYVLFYRRSLLVYAFYYYPFVHLHFILLCKGR